MERWHQPPQREFLPQRRCKVPGSRGSHEAAKLERMRKNEVVLVRSAKPSAGNAGALRSDRDDSRPDIFLWLKPNERHTNGNKETGMITLCIRYTLDISK